MASTNAPGGPTEDPKGTIPEWAESAIQKLETGEAICVRLGGVLAALYRRVRPHLFKIITGYTIVMLGFSLASAGYAHEMEPFTTCITKAAMAANEHNSSMFRFTKAPTADEREASCRLATVPARGRELWDVVIGFKDVFLPSFVPSLTTTATWGVLAYTHWHIVFPTIMWALTFIYDRYIREKGVQQGPTVLQMMAQMANAQAVALATHAADTMAAHVATGARAPTYPVLPSTAAAPPAQAPTRVTAEPSETCAAPYSGTPEPSAPPKDPDGPKRATNFDAWGTLPKKRGLGYPRFDN